MVLQLANNANCQSVEKYIGSYHLGEYQGHAQFGFDFIDGDTIYNDSFVFRNANIEHLISSQDHHFDIQGSFVNGTPHGKWKFEFDQYKLAKQSSIVVKDKSYIVKVDGVHHAVNGNLSNGKLNGKWDHHIERLNASKAEKTLFKSQISFSNGVPQKSFRIENEQIILAGRFLRDGLAHDVWELYTLDESESTERWSFNNGILRNIVWQIEDSLLNIPIYDSTPFQKTKVLNLDSRYLTIVKLQHLISENNPIAWNSEMAQLLSQNAKHYTKISDILSNLGNEAFAPEFKVKVPDLPLNELEIDQLKSITTSLNETKNKVSEILKNTQVNLLKLTDSKVDHSTKVLEAIDQQHLTILGSIVQYYEEDVLPYVSRTHLLKNLWPDSTSYTDILLDEYLTAGNFSGVSASNYKFSKGGIDDVYELTKYTMETVAQLERSINEKLTRDQQEKALASLEEKLVEDVRIINTRLDSLIEARDNQPEVTTALSTIKTVTKKELTTYSELEDLTVKQDSAKYLLSCFEDMNKLITMTNDLPEKHTELKTLYTDQIWNPFTSTLMDEIVKRHLFESYQEIVIPELYNRINTNLSCKNVTSNTSIMEALHIRMTELRNEETSKLERKLKREKNPEVVLSLLRLKIKTQIMD